MEGEWIIFIFVFICFIPVLTIHFSNYASVKKKKKDSAD